MTRRTVLAAVLASAALGFSSYADQINKIDTGSLTTFLPHPTFTNPGTRVQQAGPIALQRGVDADGTLRAPSVFGWAIAANPFGEAWSGRGRLGEMRLDTGAVQLTQVDLTFPAEVPWVIGRAYSCRQEKWNSGTSAFVHHDSNGYQGKNWFQLSQPELLFTPGGTASDDRVYIVYGPDRFVEFKRTGLSDNTFRAMNGAAGIMEYVAGTLNTYVLHDQRGNTVTFFGGNNNAADWQLWKIVNANSDVAYVGSLTVADAVTYGFDGNGRIILAFDSSGRRYSYDYTSGRLDWVKAETLISSTWTEVGRVDYLYHSGSDATGSAGDLKRVTITTPLSPSTVSLTQERYYRYYKTPEEDPALGYPHQIKLEMAFEGTRNFDYSGDYTFDHDHENAGTSDSALRPYASMYFEYEADGATSPRRIKKATFSGECGCGSLANGEHEFSYGASSSYSTYLGNSQYDAGWATRTVVKQPDGAYRTQYFDEVGQPLSTVITSSDPAGSPTYKWVTEVARSSWNSTDAVGGFVEAIHSPANNTGYTHSSGAITHDNSNELVTHFVRMTTSDTPSSLVGFLKAVTYSDGATASANYLSYTGYDAQDQQIASGVNVTRPFITAQRAYHTAGTSAGSNYDETTYAYTFYANTSPPTSVLEIIPETIITSLPIVSDTKNGSGLNDDTRKTSVYLLKTGRVAFTKSQTGIIGYRSYDDNGQTAKAIEDADTSLSTNPGDDFYGIDIPDGFDSWGDEPMHRRTLFTYDRQGRSATVTLPSSRITMSYYTRLVDQRRIVLSIPRVEYGVGDVTDKGWGPIGITASNQSCQIVWAGTAAASAAGVDLSAIGSWVAVNGDVDFRNDDPIQAWSPTIGPIFRMATKQMSEAGTKVIESRSYFAIPSESTPEGTENTEYDATRYAYDAMGRLSRTQSPGATSGSDNLGTITRTVFDALGRVSQQWVGTNDNSNGGLTGGSSNMVKVAQMEYDGGSGGGNSHLTTRTAYIQDSDTDKRETTYEHDFRGRAIVQNNPQAPHVVRTFDNLGRQTAVGLYSSTSGLTETTDPVSVDTNRVALSQMYYDERGRVWKSERHNIDEDGTSLETLLTLTWFDPAGRVMKVDGEQLVKYVYNRVGWLIDTAVLASDDDSAYSTSPTTTSVAIWDAAGGRTHLEGDKILQEQRTSYETTTGNALMRATIGRHHGDTSGTGPLDSNADADLMKYTAANITGRIQITSMWYDELDRLEETVAYGTYGIVGDGSTTTGTFDRTGMTVPSRSATALRTSYTYTYDAGGGTTRDDGRLHEVTDPGAKVARTLFDAADRTTARIRNYVNGTPSGEAGDDDVYTRFDYAYGRMYRLWVDLDGDGTVDTSDPPDQATRYIYGTVKASPSAMKITTGHLLKAVVYPDSTNPGTTTAYIDGTSSADVVSYAYNAQGQVTYTKDQAGNIIETDYDTGGRETHRRATTVVSPFDTAVKRISTTYTGRGEVDLVTQYDHATVGSGSVTDQVQFAYDGWGNVLSFTQDPDSVISGGSGRGSYSVSHTYAKATSGRNTVRRASTMIPGETIGYVYSSGIDGSSSRVSSMTRSETVGGTTTYVTIASYKYIGVAQLVGTDLNEPNIYDRMYGSSTGDYPDLDRFDRVIKSKWVRGSSTPRNFYDLDIAYDENSNITHVEDNIHTSGTSGGGDGLYDVAYTMDGLDRLQRAEEGNWASGVITSGKRARDEWWRTTGGASGLSQPGNWLYRQLDLNGDGDFLDSGEEEQTTAGGFNTVNEQTSRSYKLGNTSRTLTPGHDAVGNLTSDDTTSSSVIGNTYTWDVFGRLRTVTAQKNAAAVAEYRYNGLGFRIGWHYDADADSDIDSNDPWYYFAYDEDWRLVATLRGSDSASKESFIFNKAGLGGFGGSSYIDSVVMRTKDANTAWTSASDGTREEERYYAQNWRGDVSLIVKDTGAPVEWVKYSSYGVPICIKAGDVNSDGNCTGTGAGTDYNTIASWPHGTYDARADLDGDGDVDSSDLALFSAENLGRGKLSRPDTANRVGYAGYQWEPNASRYLARHRWFDQNQGRWLSRDPIGYSSNPMLYAYTDDDPVSFVDPSGLLRWSWLQAQPVRAPGRAPVRNPGRSRPGESPHRITRVPEWTDPKAPRPIERNPEAIPPPWGEDPGFPVVAPPGTPTFPGTAGNPDDLLRCPVAPRPTPAPRIKTLPKAPPPDYPRDPKEGPPEDPCEQAKRYKEQVCTGYGCNENMPDLGTERGAYCAEAVRRVLQGIKCLQARQNVTDICHNGIGEWGHDQQEREVENAIDTCSNKWAQHCARQRIDIVPPWKFEPLPEDLR